MKTDTCRNLYTTIWSFFLKNGSSFYLLDFIQLNIILVNIRVLYQIYKGENIIANRA